LDAIRREGDAIVFRVRLTPRGGRDAIDGWGVGADGSRHLKARVAVPPEGGRANTALIALLAKSLRIPKAKVAIVAGHAARLKTMSIAAPEIEARLAGIGEDA
jgi:uncharacterized protein